MISKRQSIISVAKLDFSHLGVWQSASAKESINAPGTFCGSVCASNPQKVPDLQGDRNRLLSAGGGGEDTLPKGRGLKTGVKASDWPVSEPCELPCQDRSSRARAPGAPLSWRGWATSTPTLSAPKWLKSSFTEFYEVELLISPILRSWYAMSRNGSLPKGARILCRNAAGPAPSRRERPRRA
jgi:hypothetical protein